MVDLADDFLHIIELEPITQDCLSEAAKITQTKDTPGEKVLHRKPNIKLHSQISITMSTVYS